jgi:26S proteasome regulatory subunit N1
MKKQLAFLLARAQIPIEWLRAPASEDADAEEEELPADIIDCLSNANLSRHFKEFGKEVGVEDPKSLEDVYKSHLETTSTSHLLDVYLHF